MYTFGGFFMLKEIKIELTNRCARNCIHCSSSATSNLANIKELDLDDVKKFIVEAREMGVESIVFTGGEPLMYDGIFELVSLVHKLKMKSTLYTFAYRNEENLLKYQKLIELGLNKIIYSLADSLSYEEDKSTYSLEDFFNQILLNSQTKLGFHYAVSNDSFNNLFSTITNTIDTFKDKSYFDKISLLRFVPHGKGSSIMDLSREELLKLKEFYLQYENRDKIRLGTPWNILGIEHNPCIIADEIMIIGFDGIAYPCDSIKYFQGLGIAGNIKEDSLATIYNSPYFESLRRYQNTSCTKCEDYAICKSGCLGQKIIASYEEDIDKDKVLRRCIQSRDPKCMR